jgi:signal transduction histidine kinase
VLGIVISQVLKMQELANRILEIGQLERQQVPLNRVPIEMAHLISEALKLQTPLASAKGLRLESDVPPDLPPAWADAELIGRVLQNLLDNACKFTPPGGVVRVAARVGESEGRPALFVSVADTGPGIPDEIRARLFEKFVRGRQVGLGSGLGLAFCKLAVEAHGGRITVDSSPERRTTFTFSLPVAPQA